MVDAYPRWQIRVVNTLLQERRAVMLTGPRQCGKTTLARGLVSDDFLYRTLDDETIRQAAEADPKSFVTHGAGTLIIDEIQRVPALLPAIKLALDWDNRPGQFLLTGSVAVQNLPSVQESLAGRIANVRLRPLTQAEMTVEHPAFLKAAFGRNFEKGGVHLDRPQLIDAAFRGGYPEAIRLVEQRRSRWHRDYIAALLDRDLRDIAQIQRMDAMRALIRTVAAWSGKLMDVSAIGSGLSIRRATLESYLNALETLYLIERVPAWTRTDYGRVGKRDKVFMTDAGLAASILRWRRADIHLDPDRLGKLFETFVFAELATQIDAADGRYTLHHYRDREKREIDFIIEREDSALLGIEVKASATVTKGDFKHLAWFRDGPGAGTAFTGIVLYSGELTASFGDGLWAVPHSALWQHDS